MTRDWEAQAARAREQDQKGDEQAGKTDELAKKADEQAKNSDEQAPKADEQPRHLFEIVEKNFSSLRMEAQQYTYKTCDSVKNEVLEKVQSLKGEVHGLRDEVEAAKRRHREAVESQPTQDKPTVARGGVAELSCRGHAASRRSRWLL